jgi:cysteine-rich repeat protein
LTNFDPGTGIYTCTWDTAFSLPTGGSASYSCSPEPSSICFGTKIQDFSVGFYITHPRRRLIQMTLGLSSISLSGIIIPAVSDTSTNLTDYGSSLVNLLWLTSSAASFLPVTTGGNGVYGQFKTFNSSTQSLFDSFLNAFKGDISLTITGGTGSRIVNYLQIKTVFPTSSSCGDGVIQNSTSGCFYGNGSATAEECDDGNTANNDGCNSDC